MSPFLGNATAYVGWFVLFFFIRIFPFSFDKERENFLLQGRQVLLRSSTPGVLDCTEGHLPEAMPLTVVKSLVLEVLTILFKKDSLVFNIMYIHKIRQWNPTWVLKESINFSDSLFKSCYMSYQLSPITIRGTLLRIPQDYPKWSSEI